MTANKGGKGKPALRQGQKNFLRRSQKEQVEIKDLLQKIAEGAPPRGTNPLALEDSSDSSYAGAKTFDELPLSSLTRIGLKKSSYFNLTAIQRAALPHALAGRDILGAAKTGSGKTLSFLIPLVEKLFLEQWTKLDGLGGLVLTPTRELAVQIFEELKKVGSQHDLSAGLLIGGKNIKEEQQRVNSLTIIVATPGRLLQHMDETPGFDASALQILVLDEADRILDLGFAATVDAVLGNLPPTRQTMLFSATQTKKVKDLARLSLRDPEFLSVHQEATSATPVKLQQAFMEVEASTKMDIIWGFLKTHLKAKTIVFLSTCKEVRFMFEAFRKLRPGVPLRGLHGGMKQMKRTAVFYEFCEASSMVLFATDVAARGLDFPSVDWVLQADCPEDAATYIHRVGRTARYTSAGRALLLLLPSEREAMLAALEAARVPLKELKHNPQRAQPVTPALQALLSKDTGLKEFAQRALTSYLRSVFLQPDKNVFDVHRVDAEGLAAGMGLATLPRMWFLKKGQKAKDSKKQAEKTKKDGKSEDEEEGSSSEEGSSDAEEGDEVEKPDVSSDEEEEEEEGSRKRGRATAVAGKKQKEQEGAKKRQKREEASMDEADEGEDDEDIFTVKRANVFGFTSTGAPAPAGDAIDLDALAPPPDASGKKKKKKQRIKVGGVSGQRVVFDEAGAAMDPLALLVATELGRLSKKKKSVDEEGSEEEDEDATTTTAADADGVYVVAARPQDRYKAAAALMRKRDKQDRARLKDLRKEMRQAARARSRAAEEGEGAAMPVAPGGDMEYEEEEEGSGSGSGSDSDSGSGRQ